VTRRLRWTAITLLALTAATPQEKLAWIARTDPQQMLERDLAAGRSRFLSVCGEACEPPGIGDMNYRLCYSAAAGIKTLEGTSDRFTSGAERELQRRAYEFAKAYNEGLARALDARNQRACPAGEDWDSLDSALYALVRGLTPEPGMVSLSTPNRVTAGGYRFLIEFHGGRQLEPKDRSALCAAAVANGVHRAVRFAVKPDGAFVCANGSVLPDLPQTAPR
jgi:hypothetical protein